MLAGRGRLPVELITMSSPRTILLGVTLAAACSSDVPRQDATKAPPAPPTLTAAANVKELMTSAVTPASSVIFQVAETAPVTVDDWTRVRTAAATLVESADALLLTTLAPSAGETAWRDACRALQEAGRNVLVATEHRNVDGVMAAGDQVYMSCETCHMKYLPQSPP